MFGLGKSKQKSIGSASMSQAESILQSTDTAPPISNNKYNWAAHYKGDFSGIERITPEDVEAAKLTQKELKEQVKLQREKMTADTDSLESTKRIFKSEESHKRQRLGKILDARDGEIRTGEYLNGKLKPGLHEQNLRLSLAKEKGESLVSRIDERFQLRRQKVAEMRESIYA
ncbi:MAG: hypothetical protein AAFO04_29650 [Cyanobacteria bacterium J06592_8]